MDFECNFVCDLASAARDRWGFDGLYTSAVSPKLPEVSALAIQDILWQGLAGETLEEELLPLALNGSNWYKLEHDDLAELLLEVWSNQTNNNATIQKSEVVDLHNLINKELTTRSTVEKTPMSSFLYAAAKFS